MSMMENLKKTVSFARRNGVGAAFAAARERIGLNREPYSYEAPSEEELRAQRAAFSRRVMEAKGERLLRFSVVVPLYLTPKPFLEEMIASVKAQTYGEWELICADASPRERNLRYAVEQAARDSRVLYLPLAKNAGIAGNTNAAIERASGEYVILLDHDDTLAPDALWETEQAIGRAKAGRPLLVYGDEDKFETDDRGNVRFFEPHRKPDFDPERLYSNNYICHPAAVRSDVIKRLRMRSEYDGSQDYDLFLRIANEALFRGDFRDSIVHLPKVLYHWRVHGQSTASNPANKDYAFDAGKRAIADALTQRLAITGTGAQVKELPHKGFYRVEFEPDLFTALPDVGGVGGKVTDREGTILGGRMEADGIVWYEGLKKGHSGGFQHPAVLVQEAYAVDLRCVRVRRELQELYLAFALPEKEEGIRARSLAFAQAVHARGFRLLWDPQFEATVFTQAVPEKRAGT